MYNVNGNYVAGAMQDFTLIFGPSDNFNVGNRTYVAYKRSVDLLSENALVPSKNKVGDTSLSEEVEFEWKVAEGSRLTVFGEAKVSHFSSKQTNFKDFTVYSRRGYSDAALNKNNFVWNARASYTMLDGRLSFMVDGFDILHNLSNVIYSVNAQARTETYTNVLPRYVMLHVQWKLHKAPKKR